MSSFFLLRIPRKSYDPSDPYPESFLLRKQNDKASWSVDPIFLHPKNRFSPFVDVIHHGVHHTETIQKPIKLTPVTIHRQAPMAEAKGLWPPGSRQLAVVLRGARIFWHLDGLKRGEREIYDDFLKLETIGNLCFRTGMNWRKWWIYLTWGTTGQRGLNLDMLMHRFFSSKTWLQSRTFFYVIMGLNSRTFAPELRSYTKQWCDW